jgi:hypothetical protein
MSVAKRGTVGHVTSFRLRNSSLSSTFDWDFSLFLGKFAGGYDHLHVPGACRVTLKTWQESGFSQSAPFWHMRSMFEGL